jgi:hypothetical protein
MPTPSRAGPNSRRNAVSRWLFWLSLAAYATSLALPAYRTNYYGVPQNHFGLEAFVLGPVGFFAGHFSWTSNLLLWRSWATRKSHRPGLSFALAVLAFIVAAVFPLGSTIAVGSAGEFPYQVEAGFYAWLVSIALAAIIPLVYSASSAVSTSTRNVP